jgi:hypothetical protein
LWPVIDGLLRKKPAERMTARDAIVKLTEIAGRPASTPPGTRVPLDLPTDVVDPAGERTVVHGTVPNTRSGLPPWHAPGSVAPDAPTIPPTAEPRSARVPLIVIGAVAVAVAVVIVVVVANLPSGGQGGASPTTTTTTAGPPAISLKPYQERLGFKISVPPDWQRTSTIDGPLSSVAWEGKRTDPKFGALRVEVQRITGKPGVAAIDVLTAEHNAQSTSPQNGDYRKIELSGSASSADFECTYRTGAVNYHTRTRAVVSGQLFKLTFSLYATDSTTLAEQWAAAEPLIAGIRLSFELAQ